MKTSFDLDIEWISDLSLTSLTDEVIAARRERWETGSLEDYLKQEHIVECAFNIQAYEVK